MVRVQIERLTGFDENAAALLSLIVPDGQRELREYLENESVKVFVAKLDNKVEGVVCILETPDTVDLLDIVVSSDKRRCGIGKTLVDAVLSKDTILEVRRSNVGAISFYKSLGFEQISVRKNYYSAPVEDALIFMKGIL